MHEVLFFNYVKRCTRHRRTLLENAQLYCPSAFESLIRTESPTNPQSVLITSPYKNNDGIFSNSKEIMERSRKSGVLVLSANCVISVAPRAKNSVKWRQDCRAGNYTKITGTSCSRWIWCGSRPRMCADPWAGIWWASRTSRRTCLCTS